METRISLYKYINQWADKDKHPESVKDGKQTDFAKGYEAACKDIFNKLYDNKIIVEANMVSIKIESEEKKNGTKPKSK